MLLWDDIYDRLKYFECCWWRKLPLPDGWITSDTVCHYDWYMTNYMFIVCVLCLNLLLIYIIVQATLRLIRALKHSWNNEDIVVVSEDGTNNEEGLFYDVQTIVRTAVYTENKSSRVLEESLRRRRRRHHLQPHDTVLEISQDTGYSGLLDLLPKSAKVYCWVTPRGSYVLKDLLREGSFGRIFKVQSCEDWQEYVVKTVPTSQEEFNVSKQQHLRNEISVLSEIRHSHIVRMVDHDDRGTNFMVLEYAEFKDIKSFYCWFGPLSADDRFRVFHEVVSAVAYLHKVDICHRDLKPENILLDEELRVKLCDFGLAFRGNGLEGELALCTCYDGTIQYLAPEVFLGRPFEAKKADIFSLGATSFYIFFANDPFPSRNIRERILIPTPPLPVWFWRLEFKVLRNLLLKMMAKHARCRPTANQVLRTIAHPV